MRKKKTSTKEDSARYYIDQHSCKGIYICRYDIVVAVIAFVYYLADKNASVNNLWVRRRVWITSLTDAPLLCRSVIDVTVARVPTVRDVVSVKFCLFVSSMS